MGTNVKVFYLLSIYRYVYSKIGKKKYIQFHDICSHVSELNICNRKKYVYTCLVFDDVKNAYCYFGQFRIQLDSNKQPMPS